MQVAKGIGQTACVPDSNGVGVLACAGWECVIFLPEVYNHTFS